MSATLETPSTTTAPVDEEVGEGEPEFPQLPLFEGQRITEFTVNFGGNVPISSEDLIKALRLNKEAELRITVRVASRGHKVVRDESGTVVKTVSSSNLVVQGISLDSDE